MANNNTVFHYCSMDKFCSIIKSATIRLSNIQNMNDALEWVWIKSNLEGIIANSGIDLLAKADTYYQDGVSLQDIMMNYISKLEQNVFPNIYAMCFSQKGDILSQWRGYANDGTGISIGFNKNLLESFEHIDCQGIVYNTSRQRKVIEEQIQCSIDLESTILSYVEEGHTYQDALNLLVFEEDDFRDMLWKIFEHAPFFKSPAFSEEKEWRISCNKSYLDDEFSLENGLEEKGLKLNYIDFDICGNKVVDYFVLDFHKKLDSIIQKIIIGPKCQISKDDIYKFLKQYGYEISKSKIIKSTASYR